MRKDKKIVMAPNSFVNSLGYSVFPTGQLFLLCKKRSKPLSVAAPEGSQGHLNNTEYILKKHYNLKYTVVQAYL